jgi:hypothetical protein
LEPQVHRDCFGGCRFECLLNGGIGRARRQGVGRALRFRTSHCERPKSDFRWYGFLRFNNQHRGSKVGRVELAPNSNLRLSFAENSITAMLETGSAQVSTLTGTTVNLTTKDGTVVVDGTQPTTFTVSASRGRTHVATLSGVAQFKTGGAVKQIAAGESATAGTPNPQGDDDDDGLSGGALAVLLLAVGGAVAGVLYAAFHNNDLNFGGSVTVISPTK